MALLSRRGMLAGAAASLPVAAMASEPAVREVASGLRFPEGVVTFSNGDLALVEIARGTVTRIPAGGRPTVVGQMGGGPNGMAIGLDGAAYVANNGGLLFRDMPEGKIGLAGVPEPFAGGSIQRLDLKTGAATTLYREVGGHGLRGPNDLVFDGLGGFWFTDTGKNLPRSRDNGGLYWATPDGKQIREVVYPLLSPNGVALSPDRRTLYVALSPQRQIVAYDIVGPGLLASQDGRPKARVVASLGGVSNFDNLAVEQDGNIVVAAIFIGALLVLNARGDVIDTVKMPEGFPTALAFGGPGMRTLYVTLSTTGRVVALDWPRAGMAPLYRL